MISLCSKATFLSEFFSLVRKERKGQKEECFDSRLGDANTHASHMCQSPYHAGRRWRRPLQDKVQYSQNKKCAFHSVSALAKPTPATHLYAGVQTMRARICSAFSCAMFARVVWLRFRRAAKPPTFALFYAALTCHAWLARLTRARRQWFGRRTA